MGRPLANVNVAIVAGGVSEVLAPNNIMEQLTLYTSGAVVLAGNVTVSDDGTWVENMGLDILYRGSVTLGAFNITIFGYQLTQAQATAGNLYIKVFNIGGAFVVSVLPSMGTAQIGTADIANEAVTVGKMADLARGSIIVGGASDRPVALDVKTSGAIPIGDGTDIAAHTVTGDITMTNGGVTAIGAGKIVNTDINATAGIEVSKFQAMTNGQIIVGNTGSGSIATIVSMSDDVALAASGAATIQAGVVTPAKTTTNITDDEINIDVSFAAASNTGKYTTTMPCNFTLLSVYGIVTSAIAGTDDGTVTPNIAGVAVTGGLLTFPSGSALNVEATVTAITASNSGSAGDKVNFVVQKTTAGGTARITVKYRRTS